MQKGTLKQFSTEQGFGLVELEDGTEMPVDVSVCSEGLPPVGADVEVEVGVGRLNNPKVVRLVHTAKKHEEWPGLVIEPGHVLCIDPSSDGGADPIEVSFAPEIWEGSSPPNIGEAVTCRVTLPSSGSWHPGSSKVPVALGVYLSAIPREIENRLKAYLRPDSEPEGSHLAGSVVASQKRPRGLWNRLKRALTKRREPERKTLVSLEARESAYLKLFGDPETILHSAADRTPHVDVYQYPGVGDRDWMTLVTGGMSDIPMNVPPQEAPLPTRVELVLWSFVGANALVFEYLHAVASFPSTTRQWLGHGFTIAPPELDQALFFPGSELVATVIVDALVEPEMQLPSMLVLDGDPVHLLMPIPLSAAEYEYVVEHGIEGFFDGPCDSADIDILMFNPLRKSVL